MVPTWVERLVEEEARSMHGHAKLLDFAQLGTARIVLVETRNRSEGRDLVTERLSVRAGEGSSSLIVRSYWEDPE